MVADLTSAELADRSRGLETLAGAYWKPVYTYLRLRWSRSHEEASDLTQEFFARAVEKESLALFDSSRARLRTYLRLLVDGLVANELKAAARQKRGGGATHLSLDFDAARGELDAAGALAAASPEDLFEKEWARSVFTLAVERLRDVCESRRKELHYRLFSAYDLEADAEGDRPSYTGLAVRFGIPVTDVTNHLAFARREFRRLVLDVLRELTASEAEFRLEARALLGLEMPP